MKNDEFQLVKLVQLSTKPSKQRGAKPSKL